MTKANGWLIDRAIAKKLSFNLDNYNELNNPAKTLFLKLLALETKGE